MEIILDVVNGKTCLSMGNRDIYNLSDISNNLKRIPKDFKRCVINNNDMYLRGDGYTLILKDYKHHLDDYAYGYVINSVDSDIPVMNRQKVNKINKKLLAGALAVFTFVVIKTSINEIKNTPDIPEEIVEIDDSKVFVEPVNVSIEPVDANIEIEEPTVETLEVETEQISEPEQVYSTTVENEPFKSSFGVGVKLDDYTSSLIDNFTNSPNFEPFIKYSNEYGIDPYLLLALATSETGLDHTNTIPGGSRFNGCGIGIMQIENANIGSTISTFNYETNTTDSITITNENIIDYDTNVKIGSIMFKNCLDKYCGNIYLTIQSYNYGIGMMDRIIELYALDNNITKEDVMNNYEDMGWMSYVKDVHNNPNKYISNWNYNTYGCDFYVESVLGYYTGDTITNSLVR